MTPVPDLRVLSLGGGTQSCALALMSARGDLERLDAVVFADTQGELPETYAYLEGVIAPALAEAGIPYHVVSTGSLYDALMQPGRTSDNPTPPAHVVNPDGSKGRIGNYRCSYDFKRRIIERTVKGLCGPPGAWKRSTVEQWIGFSTDELSRMRQDNGCRCGHVKAAHRAADGKPNRCEGCRCAGTFAPWRHNRWPLIELGHRRGDTIRWFGEHGYPTPPRSACWFCPNQGNARWRALRDGHPDLFDRAVVLDETIRDGGGFNQRGREAFQGRLFLHGSVVPLAEADLRSRAELAASHGQAGLFDEDALGSDCAAGVCFT